MGRRFVALAMISIAYVFGAAEVFAGPVNAAPTAQVVWQVLSERCLNCHGKDGKKFKSGLDLRTRESALKGGERGAALVPGDPEKSLLYIAVTRNDEDLQMPPKEKDKLEAEQVQMLRAWIAGGAPWPENSQTSSAATKATASTQWSNASADGVVVATSGGLSPDWDQRKYKNEDLWAYQPIKRQAIPSDVLAPNAANNPIDAFIQNKLKQKGVIRTAGPADKLTLIRRVNFDLTGLPPSLQDVQKFLDDDSPEAYQSLVKRLLASPQYGEQMARHWLDVARYADTSGFSNDFERPNAWRYRDYVIRSFNEDKPYDQFVVEQLAGDEVDPNDPEMLIAAGFLRMGPWEHTDMTVATVTRQRFLDDVTQSVGVTFLGQAVRCASCHDHKFDPIPTRDYYRLQAVFGSTQFAERPAPFLKAENVDPNSKEKLDIERRLKEARSVATTFQKKSQQAIAAYLKEKNVADFEQLPHEGRPNKGEFGLTNEELSLRKINRKRIDYLERELDRFSPLAFSVYSGPTNNYSSVRPEESQRDKPVKRRALMPEIVPVVHILTGGSLESPADEVTPGVLSAVYNSNERAAPTSWNTIPPTTSGRRLALATWIASPNNTLTARVIVNRVWQEHFGKGLVATPNNFGKMGAKPTHPELLDYLATWFIEHGWSLKKLHELIVTSATYRQAGSHPDMEKLLQLDSKDDLLAYCPPRRLAAEEIRDATLAASGELNLEIGGPGIFPEINWEVSFQPRHIMGSVAPAYQPSRTPQERNRRTIYAFRYRTLSDPMLEVFNRPGSETSCERRDQTTVTPQAFALLNSEFSQHRALAMAASLRRDAQSLDKQIDLAFRRVYGRAPMKEELLKSTAHVNRMLEHHRSEKPRPTTLPVTIARHMVEEMTGEEMHWDEELYRLKDYQRDLMPWDAEAETRALAELCLVLLNSNEFLYVR